MTKRRFQNKTGFTLVESLVSITVFLVVVTMVGSIYISFVRQERKLYTYLKTENNIRFALDYMGRDIRMAKKYTLDNNFSSGSDKLTLDQDYTGSPLPVIYELGYLPTDSEHKNKNIIVTRNGIQLGLLDAQVNVNFLKFYVTNGVKGVNQPTVIVTLQAIDQNNNEYNLETAVTPRNLNLGL